MLDRVKTQPPIALPKGGTSSGQGVPRGMQPRGIANKAGSRPHARQWQAAVEDDALLSKVCPDCCKRCTSIAGIDTTTIYCCSVTQDRCCNSYMQVTMLLSFQTKAQRTEIKPCRSFAWCLYIVRQSEQIHAQASPLSCCTGSLDYVLWAFLEQKSQSTCSLNQLNYKRLRHCYCTHFASKLL